MINIGPNCLIARAISSIWIIILFGNRVKSEYGIIPLLGGVKGGLFLMTNDKFQMLNQFQNPNVKNLVIASPVIRAWQSRGKIKFMLFQRFFRLDKPYFYAILMYSIINENKVSKWRRNSALLQLNISLWCKVLPIR